MNKEELIGKLQMVYVGDKNALNEMIDYYDELFDEMESWIEDTQKLKKQYCERTDCSGRIGNSKKVEELQNENQQLKIQISAREEVCDRLEEENKKYKNQQKEFIKWLEDYLNLFDYRNIEEQAGYDMLEEILQKYREIIGGKDVN